MVGRANARRGEVEAIIDGERRILCLTLGALAELETAFCVDNIADLAARFGSGNLGADGMIKILAAGLRGGGNCMQDEDARDMHVEGGIEGAIRLTASLLTAAFAPSASLPEIAAPGREAGAQHPFGGNRKPAPFPGP
jgi:hypothetical protein